MLRPRHVVLLLALILALPSAALAQGAGDDQYQDPFGDEPAAQQQQEPSQGEDDGLSDEPPGGGGGSGGSGGSGGGGGSGGSGGSTTTPQTPTTPAAPADENGLPYTGSDPRPLLLVGAAFVLMGIGLRLRTIDPDAY